MNTQELKNQIHSLEIKDIATGMLGMEVRKIGGLTSVLCPNHEDHNYGNCFLKGGYVRCFACGWKADAIGLVEKVRGVSFKQALLDIADYAGIAVDLGSTTQRTERYIEYMVQDLAIIGIYDIASFKALYAENREVFWGYIEECLERAAMKIAIAELFEDNEEVSKSLEGCGNAITKLSEITKKYREEDNPEIRLVVRG